MEARKEEKKEVAMMIIVVAAVVVAGIITTAVTVLGTSSESQLVLFNMQHMHLVWTERHELEHEHSFQTKRPLPRSSILNENGGIEVEDFLSTRQERSGVWA